ncbi:MAG TPA: SDR family oxidoreductase, partial [bacterium]|nr:SDR family oxidoreductase [bacterium]
REIKAMGRKARMISANLAKDKEVKRMFKEIKKFASKLDLVVNNAGFDYAKLIEDFSLEEMREVIDVVLFGKISITKLALPLLKKSGSPSIINIASRMGKEKTIRTIGAYGPAEAGVIKFTQVCALEFADYGIRVNCIAPGLTETDMTRNLFHDEKDWERFANSNPSRRVGHTQDVANTISFIASEKASYINGETIGVNGGSNLG